MNKQAALIAKPESNMPPAKAVSSEELKTLIVKAKHVLFIAGQPIDGDSLASALAFARMAKKMGKRADVASADAVPAGLAFLIREEKIVRQPDFLLYDAIVVLDCGELNNTGYLKQISKLILNEQLATVVNVDHHLQQPIYGNLSMIDPKAAATGLIVYRLLQDWQIELDEPIATALLTTLYHDTGSFQHSNTSIEALRMAAECVRFGADAADIAAKLYRDKPLKVLRLWGRALSRLEFNPKNQMAVSIITHKDLRELNVAPEEAKGIVSVISQVPESKFALLLTEEEPNTIKGSLRSDEGKDTDVARIARLLGGGGHRLASGFKIAGRIEKHDGRYRIV